VDFGIAVIDIVLANEALMSLAANRCRRVRWQGVEPWYRVRSA